MGSTEQDPLRRFSSRVDDYVRYRPTYPATLLDFLGARAGLGPGCAVADVGAGTGIFTRLLLATGARVFAVEPNADMRRAAEAESSGDPRFVSVSGKAEATTLPDHSVALVTCAQAFHWVDPGLMRQECRRILAPNGWCAIIWNTAAPGDSAFGAGYEKIKADFGTDFKSIRHESIDKKTTFNAFFGHEGWLERRFDNFQTLDYPSLKGRLLSSSYAPPAGHPGHEPMLAALQELFDRTQQNGNVRMDYVTELFLGQFK